MKNKFIKLCFLMLILSVTAVFLAGCELNISFNNNNNSNKIPATKISTERITEEDTKHFITIKGLDDADNVVWTYDTVKDYVGQYENIEVIFENNEQVLLNEAGTIVSLNKKFGTVMWKNADYQGAESIGITDSEGYIYVSSATLPYLFALTPQGKTLKKINAIEDNDLIFPSELKFTDENTLKIIFPSQVTDDVPRNNEVTVDTRIIKKSSNKVIATELTTTIDNMEIAGFNDIEKFTLTEEGDVYLTFKPDSVLARKCNDTKLLINKDVKTIITSFFGSSGYGTLVMVKKDGTVCFLDSMTTESGLTTIRTSEHENVDYAVRINTLDGFTYGLVTQNGVTYTERI